jgi:hypothetical protein
LSEGQGFGQFLARNSDKNSPCPKPLQILDSMWPWKYKHDLQAVPEGGDTSSAEAVAKKVELRQCKLALLQVDGEPIVSQDPEDSLQVVHVQIQVPARHMTII